MCRSPRNVVASPARWLAVLAVACATATAAPPSGQAPGSESLSPLNRKVLEFASARTGQKVANGECTSLATEALRYAGARRYPFDHGGDFVWGREVESFKDALPGDILQFRSAVFHGKTWVTKRRWVSWHQEYPHHTAVVAEVRRGGREVTVLHQNVGLPGADDAAKKVVQRATIRTDSLQEGGRVWIYRPVAPESPVFGPLRDTSERPSRGGDPCSGTP
jgi:hypothetical protein